MVSFWTSVPWLSMKQRNQTKHPVKWGKYLKYDENASEKNFRKSRTLHKFSTENHGTSAGSFNRVQKRLSSLV